MEGKRKHSSKSQISTESVFENMTYLEEVKFILMYQEKINYRKKLFKKFKRKVKGSVCGHTKYRETLVLLIKIEMPFNKE